MKELVLFDKTQNSILGNVRSDGDMLSLTDLWKAANSPNKKDPSTWQRRESTIELIDTVCNFLNTPKMGVLKSKRGKSNGGTWAHKNLALAYAKWLDPKLHILINEVFFQLIEEEKNPDLIADRYIKAYKKRGKDEKWIQERFEGKVVRNTFTSTLAKHGVKHDGFRQCTNAIYSPLFGGKTDVIRQKKNLPEKANIRDNLSRLELMSVKFAEELASENIKNNNLQGNNECAKASFIASNAVKDCVLKSRQKINQTI